MCIFSGSFPSGYSDCCYWSWRHSSLSSPVMRFGPTISQSHAHSSGWEVQFGVWGQISVWVLFKWRLCWQSLLKKQQTIPLPQWFIASEPAPLPTSQLCEAFELWLLVFVQRIFHFIWLSVVRGQLCTAWFALQLSIYLTWEENYDFS